MFDVGRVCLKIAGRDAGQMCVVVEKHDDHVLIDGQTRRRKCNTRHLEPTNKVLEIKSGASHDDVKKAFEKLNIEVRDTKAKKAADRPKKSKAKKEAPAKLAKAEKTVKKGAPKKEEATLDETVEAEKKAESSKPVKAAPAKAADAKAE